MEDKKVGFLDFFKEIPDHRIDRRKLHGVEEILLVTFCGMIAGCDSWNDLELFGKTKLDYLSKHLPYENGAPSDDTLRRFFRVLDPEVFESCFIKWVRSFQMDMANKIVAVDGKTSRRSFDGDSKPMHLVSAFVSELGITLGQLKTADKSNEITAIPDFLDLLDIAGSVVTIDAMGCQTKIVEKIVDKSADYLIGLKGNQGTLNEDIRLFFKNKKKGFITETEHDKGHGRIETRQCTVTENIAWLRERHPNWKNLNSIIEVKSQREIKGEVAAEIRYYISSLQANPEKILNAVRQHWGVENKLHWVLDISFNDDQCRIRKGNAPRNIAIIKKTTLNLLQIIKKNKPRVSLKAMRKLAGWDDNFLDSVLMAKF
ncbi:MAG: ISAs1 family transposase [Gammaproteobacteria bacterium]|jgi:predicted transposase YbfD/YdcC